MGTVNYGSNDYINLGFNLNREYHNGDIAADNAAWITEKLLSNYSFYYWHIVRKPGYYEGFYLDIENNFPVCFDNWEEKQEAQKEITQIKHFLFDCVRAGLVKYSPGWCTGWYTEKETKKAIREAIAAMRDEVRTTPTYTQYARGGDVW